jgi:hypothetical protein
MIALGNGTALEGVATTASTVTYTIVGLTVSLATPPVAQNYEQLAQGQLAASAGSMYSPSSLAALISSIHLANTGSSAQTVTLYVGGTAAANQIASFVIPPNGWANYEDGTGWTVFTAAGIIVNVAGILGGRGTPDAATVAFTASTRVMSPGTKIALVTNELVVGSRYRFMIRLQKTTAAGIATWTCIVAFGTNGTTADSAIATFTSGTNTAAVDSAVLIIECEILTIGAAATAACTAFYVNSLTTATGLGDIAPVPGSTATFNSAATSPFLHCDITSGASAVVVGVGSAERLT